MINKFKQKKKSKKRKPRYWIFSVTTAGFFSHYTVGSSRAMNIAYAENSETGGKGIFRAKTNKPLKRFDIPPGTLSEVVDGV